MPWQEKSWCQFAVHEMTEDTRLRLAFCVTELDPGGAERALVELNQSLEEKVRLRGEELERERGTPSGEDVADVHALRTAGSMVSGARAGE